MCALLVGGPPAIYYRVQPSKNKKGHCFSVIFYIDCVGAKFVSDIGQCYNPTDLHAASHHCKCSSVWVDSLVHPSLHTHCLALSSATIGGVAPETKKTMLEMHSRSSSVCGEKELVLQMDNFTAEFAHSNAVRRKNILLEIVEFEY